MQGYWSPNQRPMYQKPPPPYPDTGGYRPKAHQPQFHTQMPPRHSTGQQEVRTSSPQAAHLSSCRYDGQTNQTVLQPSFRGHQQHHNSFNSAGRFLQPNMQPCPNVFPQQNYRNVGLRAKQALIYWAQHADEERSRAVANDNTNGWGSHISDSGGKQQQPQSVGPANLHHQLHQHARHQQMQERPSQSNLQAQNATQRLGKSYQVQGRRTVHYSTRGSGVAPPAGPEENNSPAFNPFQQRQAEMRPCENPQASQVHRTNRRDCNWQSKRVFPERNFQSNVEPSGKRMRSDETQREYWNKFYTKSPNVSADDHWAASQSVPPAHQVRNSTEKRCNGSGQSEVTYSSDPADCLEAVCALQKAFQQVNRAVAIVPPISQQTSNTELTADVSPPIADSPPVFSLTNVCESKNLCGEAHDKSTDVSSPAVEENVNISSANETVDNITGCVTLCTDVCSAGPVAGPNDGLHKNCDSSDAVFKLSDAPMLEHTLQDLRNLVTYLETSDTPDRYTEKPESVYSQILDLYWNGSEEKFAEQMNVVHIVMRYSAVESLKTDSSVVFKSITPENLQKVTNCIMVSDEMRSSPQQFRSSWININGQPADMEKLAEPLTDHMILSKRPSENICVPAENSGVNSLQVSEVTTINADEKSVKIDSENPKEVFTPCAGNVREETFTQHEGHSDAETPGITFSSHSHSQQKTSRNQSDILENHSHVNTTATDHSSSADASSEELRDNSTTDTFIHKHIKNKEVNVEQLCDSLHVSDSLPMCHREKPLQSASSVSDSVKHLKESFSTETQNPPTNKDISDDENSGSKKELTNSTDIVQKEIISSDENSGKDEALHNSTDAPHSADISDDESDDFMIGITVLSPEDALKFFYQFEKEPECEIEAESSQSDASLQQLVTHLNEVVEQSSKDEAQICCHGSSSITSPSPDLKIKPCSPAGNEMDVLDGTTKLEELEQNGSPPSLEPELLESFTGSAAEHNADKEIKDDSLLQPVPEKTAEIQSSDKQEISRTETTKDKVSNITSVTRHHLHTQHNKAHKSASIKHKLKSGCALIGAEDPVLFAPDIVFKKNCPQNKSDGRPKTAVSVSRPGNGGVKNTVQHKQKRQTPPLQTDTDRRLQSRKEKVREKVSPYSAPHQRSKNSAEINEKIKTTKEPIKLRFTLYGSNRSNQCVSHGRRFSAPVTVTLSSVSQDPRDKISAKQKVHNQWRDTFIPQGRKISLPQSPQKKKRRQKPHEVLKSNMVALKEHLKNRAMLLSNQPMQKHQTFNS